MHEKQRVNVIWSSFGGLRKIKLLLANRGVHTKPRYMIVWSRGLCHLWGRNCGAPSVAVWHLHDDQRCSREIIFCLPSTYLFTFEAIHYDGRGEENFLLIFGDVVWLSFPAMTLYDPAWINTLHV